MFTDFLSLPSDLLLTKLRGVTKPVGLHILGAEETDSEKNHKSKLPFSFHLTSLLSHGFPPCCYGSHALLPWESYFTSLCLNALICYEQLPNGDAIRAHEIILVGHLAPCATQCLPHQVYVWQCKERPFEPGLPAPEAGILTPYRVESTPSCCCCC